MLKKILIAASLLAFAGCALVSKQTLDVPDNSIVATAADEVEKYRWRLLNPERLNDVLLPGDESIEYRGSFCAQDMPNMLGSICSKHGGSMSGEKCLKGYQLLFTGNIKPAGNCDRMPSYRLTIKEQNINDNTRSQALAAKAAVENEAAEKHAFFNERPFVNNSYDSEVIGESVCKLIDSYSFSCGGYIATNNGVPDYSRCKKYESSLAITGYIADISPGQQKMTVRLDGTVSHKYSQNTDKRFTSGAFYRGMEIPLSGNYGQEIVENFDGWYFCKF